MSVELMQRALCRTVLYISVLLCTKHLKVLQRMSSQFTKGLQVQLPLLGRPSCCCSRALNMLCSVGLRDVPIFVEEESIAHVFQTTLEDPEAHPNSVPCARCSTMPCIKRESDWQGGPVLNSFMGFD